MKESIKGKWKMIELQKGKFEENREMNIV